MNSWKNTILGLKSKGYSLKEITDLCVIPPFSEEEIANIFQQNNFVIENDTNKFIM
ncbi:hypothetical protein KKH23_04525 [Patescibacteria group bacterium]|nr:hypothetical protein [Patescibacteria group bacterium]